MILHLVHKGEREIKYNSQRSRLDDHVGDHRITLFINSVLGYCGDINDSVIMRIISDAHPRVTTIITITANV